MTELNFDAFLADATRKEAGRIEREEVLDAITQKLRASNVLHVFDPDPEISEGLIEQYALEIARDYFQNPEALFTEEYGGMPDDIEERNSLIIEQAVYDAGLRSQLEGNILRMAGRLLRHEQNGTPEDKITESKKKFLADLVVNGGISIDDEFLQFFIEVAPGGSVDFNSEEDQKFIIEAAQEIPGLEEEAKVLEGAILAILEIMHDHAGDKSLDEAMLMAQMLAMQGYEAQLKARNGGAPIALAAERDATITEICRQKGVIIDIENRGGHFVDRVFDLLDEIYPLTDENA